MEDRKRSLIADQDDTPPSKRQAMTVNGTLMRMEPEKEKEIEVRHPSRPQSINSRFKQENAV